MGPAVSQAQEHKALRDVPRPKRHKDDHEWNDREDQAYRIWQKNTHRKEIEFSTRKPSEQQTYWELAPHSFGCRAQDKHPLVQAPCHRLKPVPPNPGEMRVSNGLPMVLPEYIGNMPLPSDERIIGLSQDLIRQLEKMFGQHIRFRPAHAKGAMSQAGSAPSPEAPSLTRALIWFRTPRRLPCGSPTPQAYRCCPTMIRMRIRGACDSISHLAERVHTDIISHSTGRISGTDPARSFWNSYGHSVRVDPSQCRRQLRLRNSSALIRKR